MSDTVSSQNFLNGLKTRSPLDLRNFVYQNNKETCHACTDIILALRIYDALKTYPGMRFAWLSKIEELYGLLDNSAESYFELLLDISLFLHDLAASDNLNKLRRIVADDICQTTIAKIRLEISFQQALNYYQKSYLVPVAQQYWIARLSELAPAAIADFEGSYYDAIVMAISCQSNSDAAIAWWNHVSLMTKLELEACDNLEDAYKYLNCIPATYDLHQSWWGKVQKLKLAAV